MALVQKRIKKVFLGSTQVRPGIEWNVNNASLSKQFSTGDGFQGLYINPNENVAITAGFNSSQSKIFGYNFTNKDISTAQFNRSYTNSIPNQTHSVFANSTGTHIYVGVHGAADNNNGKVVQFNTTNRYLDNNMTPSATFTPNPKRMVQTVRLNPTESYMVTVGDGNQDGSVVCLWSLSTPGDVSTAQLVKTTQLDFTKNRHGLYFNDNMTQCVGCNYSASSGSVYTYNWNILHSDTYTLTSSKTNVGFTIGYANITADGTTMYAVREGVGDIYQYTL